MFLGIDLGTSSVKVLLLDERHTVVCEVDAALTLQHPKAGWSEQQPSDWWQAVEQAVLTLRTKVPNAWTQVQAIGLSGQMHGAVVLDSRMDVIRPAILWNDGRSSLECVVLENRVPASRQITGNLAMAGFTAPKLLWLQKHEPSVFARINKVLLPKDWLRFKLTGETVSDMSDASGTLWMDVGKRCWSAEMLAACGLNENHMPRLVEGSAISGKLLASVAHSWGLGSEVFVAGGAGDNAASGIGVGAIDAGQGFISLGTSGVIFIVDEAHRSAPAQAVHSFAHALPTRWHRMAVMLSAASAFGWVSNLTGSPSEAHLSNQVDGLSAERRAKAPLFLPYLSGERTPHNNPHASGSFTGLRSEHAAVDLGYAVMEGVAFGLMDGWFAMDQAKTSAKALALVGGGARSNAWAQLISSGLGCPLHRPNNAHAIGALGAARLAWLAVGGTQAQVCQPLTAERSFEPDGQQGLLLTQRYERFRALYPELLQSFE